jgi:hypothetical protein
MTKKELARLARKSREAGYMARSTTELAYYCPVNMEARRKDGDLALAHMFLVHRLPWEGVPSMAKLQEALARHLEDQKINGEECARWTDAERGKVVE